MKKLISVFLMIALCAGLMTACGTSGETAGNKLSIVVTIFPEYDWVMQVLGDKADAADVTLLLDNGVDLHSYQPTADDLVKISKCDLFIFVGGESDAWAEDLLKTGANEDRIVINILETLGERVKEEEVVEGMQGEEEEGEDEEEEAEMDEHVWLSLRNAQVLTGAIKDALVKLDADNADTYTANAEVYTKTLAALDEEYKAVVADAATKTLLFADRFPFRYLTEDYGLDYYAAFVGCSAETEASFETVAFLANKVDELHLKNVMTLEGTDGKIAQTVISTSKSKNAKTLAMNSMQSCTSKDVQNGVTYLSVMQNNLEVLKQALH